MVSVKPESSSLQLFYIKMANSLLIILLHRWFVFSKCFSYFFHVFHKDALLKIIKNIEITLLTPPKRKTNQNRIDLYMLWMVRDILKHPAGKNINYIKLQD